MSYSPRLIQKKLGKHLILELTQCRKNLTNRQGLRRILKKAVEDTNSTLVSVHTHQFENGSVSGIAFLLESHISVHTWVEYSYAAVDIYTCGDHTLPHKAVELFIDYFKSNHYIVREIDRGLP